MIIKSLLDVDLYKLTMMQMAFLKHRDVVVEFTFKNRSKDVNLVNHINKYELEGELKHVTTLRFKKEEVNYLRGLGLFQESFLDYLTTLTLPMVKLDRNYNTNDYDMSVKGKWCEVTLWETIILSITNELYHKDNSNLEDMYSEGLDRLYNKIDKCRYSFTEFGTRRRFSRKWQETVVKILKREEGFSTIGFKGTSNVYLAFKYGINCVGTFAHEMPMVYSGIHNEDLILSHRLMLDDWWDLYGNKLSIALTDTYGSDYFFKDFTK